MKAFKGEITETNQIKNQIFCIGKKLNLISADGVIQTEVLRQKLAKHFDNIDELIATCEVDKENPEETAYNMAKCSFNF